MQNLLMDQEQIIHEVHNCIENSLEKLYPIQIAEKLGLTEEQTREAITELIKRNIYTFDEVY